jgi:hypothetical protein
MKMRENKFDSGEGSSGSEYWYLGTEIITISTPKVEVDLYTPIVAQIKVPQQVPIRI